MNANVTASSQTHRLREQLERSHVSHGVTARADIPRVRVGAGIAAEANIFFCDVGPITVRREITAGDDSPLPQTVALDGLEFPSTGVYDVVNAIVSANGDIRIAADAETVVRRVDPVLTLAGDPY
jgi:hypothetical protein